VAGHGAPAPIKRKTFKMALHQTKPKKSRKSQTKTRTPTARYQHKKGTHGKQNRKAEEQFP
jgi:hypothetical protein